MRAEKSKSILKVLVILILAITPYSMQAQDSKSQNDYWIGQEMWYKYSGGMNFHVKFEKEGMSYQALAKSKPEMWWGPFPFNSIKTLKGEYIITWYEEGYGDYVTLLVDEKNKTIYGSALIIIKDKPHTHLQPAVIYKTIGKK